MAVWPKHNGTAEMSQGNQACDGSLTVERGTRQSILLSLRSVLFLKSVISEPKYHKSHHSGIFASKLNLSGRLAVIKQMCSQLPGFFVAR